MSVDLRFTNLRFTICFLLFLSVGLISCEDESSTIHQDKKTFKVAVFCESDEMDRWQRMARWALKNITEAQQGLPTGVELQLQYYSQDATDVEIQMSKVAEDPEIVAIIGPTISEPAELMASKLVNRPKPMITPSATLVDYQRKVSKYGFVWNMAESDIAEMEMLIACCSGLMFSSLYDVKLLAPQENGSYGDNIYAEWFGFLAEEYGMNVGDVMLYENEEDVRDYARSIAKQKSLQGVIFCPNSDQVALAFDDEYGKILANDKYLLAPNVYCTDAFIDEQIIKNIKHLSYEGIDLYAAPEAGFHQAFMQQFHEDLVNGEAQFYDALCLLSYSATLARHTEQTLNEAILSVVNGRNGRGGSWLPADMKQNFQQLAKGICPDIDGVSSKWVVDEQTHSYFIGSTYRHWRCENGKLCTLEYISTEGSRRSTTSKDMWDWQAEEIEEFDPDASINLTYPELKDRWALLVAGSSGWANYRFQADVFAMYQILKKNGYDDDHIVLIAEDDVANDTRNIFRPDLRVLDEGPNVYDHNALDYKLSTLSPDDIANILQGNATERLTKVLHPTENDNVFIFWSSHGTPGMFDFDPSSAISYTSMKDILENTPHRKMLMAVEACYGGGFGKFCEGLPGTLFITASAPSETSHADVMSEHLGIFLTNGFTRGFQMAIANNSNIILRDLYVTLARNTSGSHVKVYNENEYGNVYRESMGEYLGK